MLDLAIDLETMGRVPGAPVVAIAAVSFDRDTQEVGVYQFYAPIDMADAFRWGDKVDGDTVRWWLGQSEAARNELRNEHAATTQNVLAALLTTLADADAEDGHEFDHVRVWGNGASFDLGILGALFDRMGLLRPWKFYNERDMRTMMELYPAARLEKPADMVSHNALEDATHQARCLAEAFRLHAQRPALRLVDSTNA